MHCADRRRELKDPETVKVKELTHKPKHLALIAVMAIIAVAPMLLRGIPGGNDAIQHYEFAQQVVDSVKSGDLFPSFAGNSNHGLGDVGMRVYPPLSYYVLAGFYLVLGDWYSASISAFILIFSLVQSGSISGQMNAFRHHAEWPRRLFTLSRHFISTRSIIIFSTPNLPQAPYCRFVSCSLPVRSEEKGQRMQFTLELRSPFSF
jgi:hypothetical protein